MSDGQNQNPYGLVINLIDNPIVSDSSPVGVDHAGELFTVCRARSVAQGKNRSIQSSLEFLILEFAKEFCRLASQNDLVAHEMPT